MCVSAGVESTLSTSADLKAGPRAFSIFGHHVRKTSTEM